MKDFLDELARLRDSVSPAWWTRIRSGATLAVLVLLVFVAVRVGLDRVAEPFPASEDAPICTDVDLQQGDPVRAGDVTVSVLNAGGANGLAGRTLGALADRGFGRGQLDDAPEGTPRVVNAQIWTTEGTTAAVKLVRSHLAGPVKIIDREGPGAGLNVVVGTRFSDVKNGRNQFRAQGEETTCVPTVEPETPEASPAG